MFKKILKWGAIILGGLIFIGLFFGDDESNTTNGNTAQETSAKPAETKTEAKKDDVKKEYGIGQDVMVGKFTFKVNGVEELQTLSSVLGDKTTQGKYVVIDLTVLNGDSKARIVDGNMFKIKADGKEYSSSAELDVYVNEDIGFFLEEINPNLSKQGKVVFELPANVTSYNLEVSSGFGWSGGKYETIKIK